MEIRFVISKMNIPTEKETQLTSTTDVIFFIFVQNIPIKWKTKYSTLPSLLVVQILMHQGFIQILSIGYI
jgi:hypothetical protein